MDPAEALELVLQSGPVTPGAELFGLASFAVFVFLLASRLIVGPVLYLAARSRPSGREAWWGALGALVPLIAIALFLLLRPRAPGSVTGAWNPWVLCPWCQAPRGLTPDPCPRCGRLLPQGPQAVVPTPGYAPGPYLVSPRARRPRLGAMDVSGAQVFGAFLFTFVLAGVALYALLLPVLANPATAAQELARLSVEPAFILVGLIVQDSILIGVALDQSLFRRRLTMPEMGLKATGLRFSVPVQVALGIGAGVLTFVVSSLSVQVLVDTLNTMGADTGSAVPVVQPRIESLSDYGFWVVSGVIIAPVAEELFFRGYALSGFVKRAATNRGLIATSVLFAAVHLDPIALGPLFAAGLVLGALRIQTGSLVAPLTAHATNNFIVMTLTLLGL